MEILPLLYFMTVLEQRSVTRAARQFGVTQPALSAQIGQLEQELGVSLFERSRTGVQPTIFGRRFYDDLLPVMRGLSGVPARLMDQRGGGLTGRIRCGMPPALNKSVLPAILREFVELYPGVEVEVSEGFSGTLTQGVERGDLDLAIGAWDADSLSLRIEFAIEEDLMLVAGHPIAGAAMTPCRLDAIDGLHLCATSEEHVLGALVHNHIRRGAIRVERLLTLNGFASTMGVVRASEWAAIVPVSGIIDEMDDPAFHIYPIAYPALSYEVYCVSNSKVPLSRASSLFRDMLLRTLSGLKPGRLRVTAT